MVEYKELYHHFTVNKLRNAKPFRYALCLFHALYEPFKAFLRLPVDVGKVSVQPAAWCSIRKLKPKDFLNSQNDWIVGKFKSYGGIAT